MRREPAAIGRRAPAAHARPSAGAGSRRAGRPTGSSHSRPPSPAAPTKFKAPVMSSSAMASGYYDFAAAGWTPYVGAGLGLAVNDIRTVTVDNGAGFNGVFSGGAKTGVAGAIMAGVGIPVSARA